MRASLNQRVLHFRGVGTHRLNGTPGHLRKPQPSLAYLRGADIGTTVTAPIIYSLIVPLALLDLWVTLYQSLCFPAYRIARVRRGRFIALDRHRLPYLNGIERVNCTFCSYANGVLAYAREVAARTEQYWCPIKHAQRIPGAHRRYAQFFEFGDERGYLNGLTVQRRSLRPTRAGRVTGGLS
jgi:hypothetical protein